MVMGIEIKGQIQEMLKGSRLVGRGDMVKVIKRHKLLVTREISFGNILYSMMTKVNNTILYG